MKDGMRIGLFVFAIALAILFLIRVISGAGAVAPTPPMFADAPDGLDEAIAAAEQRGGYVFAFATADWCGPCQQFKRTTLVDPAVEEWVESHATPVYIDVDYEQAAAVRLGVRSIPATYLLKDGEVVRKIVGGVSPDALISALEEGLDAES